MKVILLQTIPKVGKKDTVVDVASGYAQHSLIPSKRAIAATPAAIAALNRQQQSSLAEKEVRHNLLDKAITALSDQHVVMNVKANKQGNLFSKITAIDIATFLMQEYRIAIDPTILTLPDGQFKKLGTFPVDVHDESYHAAFTIELVQE